MNRVRVLPLRDLPQARAEVRAIGPSAVAVEPLARKAVHLTVLMEAVPLRSANVVRHLLLAQGGDVAVSEDAYYLRPARATDMLLFGTLAQLGRLYERLSVEPPELKALGEEINQAIANHLLPPGTSKIGGIDFDWSQRCYIVGVLDASRASEATVDRGLRLVEEGADILEVAAGRPDSNAPRSAREGLTQALRAIEGLARRASVPIAIASDEGRVVKAALDAGATIVYDGRRPRHGVLASLAARAGWALVLRLPSPLGTGGARGQGRTLGEVYGYLWQRAQQAQDAGVARSQIIIDPSLGLGKSAGQDRQLLRRLPELKSLGFPIMVDVQGERGSAEARAAQLSYSLVQGANLVRTTKVREARRTIAMLASLMQ